MTEFLKIFSAFFRIGLFMFGGGYSMLPLLEREVVERHGWATREQMLDYFALSQCTPGIIAVNTAALVGYNNRGFRGAITAAAGVVTPSFIVIVAIASVLDNIANIPAMAHAFAGIRAAVAALIASAVIRLFKNNVIKTPISIIICISALLAAAVFSLSPAYIVAGAAVAGLLFFRKRDED